VHEEVGGGDGCRPLERAGVVANERVREVELARDAEPLEPPPEGARHDLGSALAPGLRAAHEERRATHDAGAKGGRIRRGGRHQLSEERRASGDRGARQEGRPQELRDFARPLRSIRLGEDDGAATRSGEVDGVRVVEVVEGLAPRIRRILCPADGEHPRRAVVPIRVMREGRTLPEERNEGDQEALDRALEEVAVAAERDRSEQHEGVRVMRRPRNVGFQIERSTHAGGLHPAIEVTLAGRDLRLG
jgi:hypothetical protein